MPLMYWYAAEPWVASTPKSSDARAHKQPGLHHTFLSWFGRIARRVTPQAINLMSSLATLKDPKSRSRSRGFARALQDAGAGCRRMTGGGGGGGRLRKAARSTQADVVDSGR